MPHDAVIVGGGWAVADGVTAGTSLHRTLVFGG